MLLSIIIVNYNTYKLTEQTIDAVMAKPRDFEYEIMLVDNASQDGSMQKLADTYDMWVDRGVIKLIWNTENLGFSKANNIGIRKSTGKYVLLLNSDTVVEEDCLEKCLNYIEKCNEEDVKIGALGCKVVLASGKLDHACKRGFPTPMASLYYLIGLHKINPEKYGAYQALSVGEDEVAEVDCLTGAFMLMPRIVLDNVGLLDEEFFMYGEDIDLCYRIKEHGYKVMYYSEAMITHYKGGSSKKKRKKIIYDFHNAMWLFYKKHYKEKNNVFTNVAVVMGIAFKYSIACLINAFKPKQK
ncbi:MAG: glycosyltransferase family 2 protein [Cellulosilyticaceae bacterium]